MWLSKRTYAAIGHIRLDRLQPNHLLDFYKQLSEPGQNKRTGGGLSPKTIKHYHTFISSVLERAVKWQIIQDNPAHRIDAPKVDRKSGRSAGRDIFRERAAGISSHILYSSPYRYAVR